MFCFHFITMKVLRLLELTVNLQLLKILHDALIDQKRDSRLIGNIGNPALSEKNITKKTIFVIEGFFLSARLQ